MSTNSEQLEQHVRSNPYEYKKAVDLGLITKDDLRIASNYGGNYSDEAQDNALHRITSALNDYAKKYPDNEKLNKFISGLPKTNKFTPNKEDWLSYNNDQMTELAKTMKFNWKNADDRKKMLKILGDEQVMRDKIESYNQYKKDHPYISWINENIIAPNTSNRLSKGEDITNKDIALDFANNAVNLVPGGKGWKMATVFGAEAANSIAQDLNQGNELGMHNFFVPLASTIAGASTDAAKYGVDQLKSILPKGGTTGKVINNLGKKTEDWLTNVDDFVDNIDDAAEAAKRSSKARQGHAVKNYDNYKTKTLDEGKRPLSKTELEEDKLARMRKSILHSKDPAAAYKSMDISTKEKLLTPDFEKAMEPYMAKEAKSASKTKQFVKEQFNWKKGLQSGVKTSTRGASRSELGQAQASNNKKPISIEKVFASPEMADYIRLKRRGYSPQIPDKFKEYKDQVDAIINDPNLNLR